MSIFFFLYIDTMTGEHRYLSVKKLAYVVSFVPVSSVYHIPWLFRVSVSLLTFTVEYTRFHIPHQMLPSPCRPGHKSLWVSHHPWQIYSLLRSEERKVLQAQWILLTPVSSLWGLLSFLSSVSLAILEWHNIWCDLKPLYNTVRLSQSTLVDPKELHWARGLISRTMAAHVRYKSW